MAFTTALAYVTMASAPRAGVPVLLDLAGSSTSRACCSSTRVGRTFERGSPTSFVSTTAPGETDVVGLLLILGSSVS
jgi:hypothetical protein